ncbi:relaxase/mobilization nuclease domain-containing protein [Paeniglutamicibacter cryotolerans]
MRGLLSYLVSTDLAKTSNVHRDPHVVAGSAAVMAWFDDGVLDQQDAAEIAAFLDQPHRRFGVQVMRRNKRWDPGAGEMVDQGLVKADVWHCSLSLAPNERVVTDQEWGDIANEFVGAMGFTESSGKAPCRWVAINHGTSTGGNQHIHLAVSLVREDGTKASVHMDQPRSQAVCRGLEQTYGLEELSSIHAARGYERAEPQTAIRQGREMHRVSLERKVRAAASVALNEAGFVCEGRNAGLLMRPRYAKGTTDVVVGYSVAERPVAGARPVWFGGGQLARDLGLGQLRTRWADTALGSMDAVAEWNAAARNQHQVKPIGPHVAGARSWEEQTAVAQRLAERLQSLAVGDHASWAWVAREASGVFATWSAQVEQVPGPLAATADELAKTAQLRDYRVHGAPVALPSLAGAAMLLLAAGSNSKGAAQSAFLLQLLRTVRAIHDMHQQSLRVRETRNLELVFARDLVPFVRDMPEPVLAGTRAEAGVGMGTEVPESVRLARLSFPLPIFGTEAAPRSGSVVPPMIKRNRTYEPQTPGPETERDR